MARTYRNFDITVRSDGPRFVLQAESSVGSTEVTTELPFSSEELSRFLDVFGGEQRRRLETDRYERTRDFGKRLYESFFTEQVRSLLAESMRAAEAESAGLRLRLHLDEAPTLVSVPWEYLYRERADDFVSLSNWTPVVRHLVTERRVLPAQIAHPLKILVMISDPIERRGTLDVEREWSQLQRSLGDAESVQKAQLTRLESGRLDELQDALREDDYHVFHFIGHGTFSDSHNDGALLLEDELGRTKIVAGRVLGDRLRDSRSMRLAVLNNCEGAATSAFDPFAGTAQSLLRKGIPAVVAMQFAVTDLSALAFSRGFYRSIIDGYPVDASVAEGRKAIDEGANRFEFGAPVLYLAAEDGAIFDIAATPQPELDDEPRPVIDPSAAPAAVQDEDEPVVADVPAPPVAPVARESAPASEEAPPPSPAVPPAMQEDLPAAVSSEPERYEAQLPADREPEPVEAQPPAEAEPDPEPLETTTPQPVAATKAVDAVQETPETKPFGATSLPVPTRKPVPRRTIAAAVIGAVVILIGVITVLNSGGDDPPPSTIAASTSAVATTASVPPTTEADVATTISVTTTIPVTTTIAVTTLTDRSIASRTAVPLTIDGSDEDWATSHIMLSDNRIYDPENEWEGQSDLSGTWRLAWDEDFLYVFAVVLDERVEHVTSGSTTWRGDAIAFNFDPDPSDNAPGDDLTGSESGVFISPRIDPAANGEWARLATEGRQPDQFFRLDDKTDSEGFLSATKVVGSEAEPTGYQLEARIPWLMLIGARTPQAGDSFKMTLDVTDDDSGGDRQQTMLSNSPGRTVENQAKPDVWELLVLE